MYYLYIATLAIISLSSRLCLADKIPLICDDERLVLNNDCSILCTHRSEKIFINYFVQISCRSSNSWSELYNVSVSLSSDEFKKVALLFLDSSFPEDFNLSKLTTSLGLNDINILLFESSNKNLTFPSKNFMDSSLSLEQLKIVGVDMPRIPNNLFHISDLRNLHIKNTTLSKLRSGDFITMNRLTFLDLSHNNISVIEPRTFDRLINLYSLDLSYNKLMTLPVGIFNQLKFITEINLGFNHFTNLPEYTFYQNVNKRLKSVQLNNNRLRNLKRDVFGDSNNLWSLNLSHNDLSDLDPDFFKDFRSLDWLSLSHNNLITLPPSIFKNTDLRVLFLSSNRLTQLNPALFDGIHSLKILDVSSNNLTEIPKDICEILPELKEIAISNNNITTLKDRQLSNFALTKEYSIFTDCKKIEKLKLNKNKISTFYYDWAVSSTLKTIELADNKITTLELDATEMHFDLDVQNNNISYMELNIKKLENVISSGKVADLKRKIKIDARGSNYLDCGCKNLDFFRYLYAEIDHLIYNYLEIDYNNFVCMRSNHSLTRISSGYGFGNLNLECDYEY